MPRIQLASPRTEEFELAVQMPVAIATDGPNRRGGEQQQGTSFMSMRSVNSKDSNTARIHPDSNDLIRRQSKLKTLMKRAFTKDITPEYVLLPGGQAVKQWDDPLECTCCPVLDPQISDFVEKWDMVIMAAVLTTALWVPIEVAFIPMTQMKQGYIFIADHMLDALFLTDMVLQFMMSFPEDREGTTRWVRDRGKIVLHYLSGWFWLDLMSLIPIDLLAAIYKPLAAEMQSLKALRLLRLFRLMKMGRLVKKWQSAWGISYGNVALLKFAFLTVMAVHWMSCMWGWLSQFSQRTWLSQLIESKNLNKEEIEYFTKSAHVYAISLYWAVMTLTSLGYGDIVAINMKEYLFCIFCFVTSGLIWAYVIGSICGIISAMDPLLLQYQQNMDLLNIMMQDNNLPEDMRRRLRLYFQESRNLQRKVNQQTVVATLSPGLQGELAMKISKEWLTRVWYFDVLEADPVIEISKRLKPMIFADGEPLMLNNNNRTLFIVIRGVAARAGVVLGKNAVIGDDMIISNPYLRNSARPNCITFVEVNYLRNEHLDEVRQAFPLAEQRIRKAQIKWAMHRGFVLAAWHRVSCGGNLAGPRTTEYFRTEVPSFSTAEAVEAYSAEVTPRGSTCLMNRRPAAGNALQRRNSLGITGMGLAAIGGALNGGMVPMSAAQPQGCGRNSISLPRGGGGQGHDLESPGSPGRGRRQRGSINAPFAVAAAAAPAEDQSAVLDMLETIRREVNEGIERLEARLERVERRVNPSMLG